MMKTLSLCNVKIEVYIPETLKDLRENNIYHVKGDMFINTKIIVTSLAIEGK